MTAGPAARAWAVDVVRKLLPDSQHDGREAAALTWLAVSARNDTRLCWPSVRTLAGWVRGSKNLIGPALGRLADAGRISILSRGRGRGAVYLIHPEGLAALATIDADDVRRHLSAGRFAAGEVQQVLNWLAGLGVFRASVPAAGTPPQTPGQFSPPQGHRRPSGRFESVPAAGTQTEENPYENERTADRPGSPDGPAGLRPDPAEAKAIAADIRALCEGLATRLTTDNAKRHQRAGAA